MNKQRTALIVGISAWLIGLGVGMKVLLDFQVKPGASARAPATWPALSLVPRGNAEPTLVLIAHPRCPCTRATFGELARLVARARRPVAVRVVFAIPSGHDSSWIEAALWQGATAIPGVRIFLDQDGIEARRFGTSTSGQVLLYDDRGDLRFAGGITPGRGHAGDNAGSDAVLAMVNTRAGPASTTPVFGCALATPPSGTEPTPSCPK